MGLSAGRANQWQSRTCQANDEANDEANATNTIVAPGDKATWAAWPGSHTKGMDERVLTVVEKVGKRSACWHCWRLIFVVLFGLQHLQTFKSLTLWPVRLPSSTGIAKKRRMYSNICSASFYQKKALKRAKIELVEWFSSSHVDEPRPLLKSLVPSVYLEVPQKYHESTTEVSQKYHRGTIQVPQMYHTSTTQLPQSTKSTSKVDFVCFSSSHFIRA